MKYLDKYYEWVKTGQLPKEGLCLCFHDDPLMDLMSPVESNGRLDSYYYWGYDGSFPDTDDYDVAFKRKTEFTVLRQNIVLLLACLNGEL